MDLLWSPCTTRRECGRIDVSLLVLWAGFSVRSLLHHGQYRVRLAAYRVVQRALARASNSVRTEEIAQKKPVVVRHSTGHGNGEEHLWKPPVAVRGMERAAKQALTVHRAYVIGKGLEVIRAHQTANKSDRLKERTGSVCREDGHGERSVDRDLYLCLIWVDESWKLRDRHFKRCQRCPSPAGNGAGVAGVSGVRRSAGKRRGTEAAQEKVLNRRFR
jgi:hypothetical protein